MNPILYSPKETEFGSFGLGVLSDCVSCTVTEERNGIFECEFQYPVSGLHFDSLQNDCLIKVKPNETKEPQLFRIYQISKPLNGIVTCKAEHLSYRLNSITVSPFTAGSAAEALVKLKANSAIENPFTFWTDLSTKAQMTVEVPSSCRSLLGGTEGSFLDVYGGEFEWDNYTVKIHKNRGQDNGVVIEYGKNLTDLNQEEVISNLITGVHPYWRSTGTEEEPGELVELDGEKVITVRTDYSYPRIIPLDLSGEFEEKPTSQQLEQKAREYIEKSGILVPSVSLKVSFAPLWQSPEYEQYQLLERVSLCDEVTVRFLKLGVDAKAKVIKTTYDVLREKYTSIELGDAKSNFADTVLDTMKEIEKVKVETGKFPAEWQQSIKNATDLLTGQKGGYIVLNTPDNPREIFVMDTPDMKTAKQVLRINLSGIGFSRTGINGPYYSAWTLDGAFVADWITAGTLTANIIRAGILSSLDGKSYWNLETGELVVSGTFRNYASNGKVGVSIEGTKIKIFNWALNGEQVGMLYSLYAQGKDYGAVALAGISNAPVHIGIEKNGSFDGYITVADNSEGPIVLHKNTKFEKPISFSEAATFNKDATFLEDVYADIVELNSIKGKDTNFNLYSRDGVRLMSGTSNGISARNLIVEGTLDVNGQKNRVVETASGLRRLSAYETAESYFGDVGEGTIGENGTTEILIDLVFLETVETSVPYHVFLQSCGEGQLWISEKKKESFTVKGTPGLSFSWEIKAKQKGYEHTRLEKKEEKTNGNQ